MPDAAPWIVCCVDFHDPKWRWLEEPLADTGVRFEFVRAVARTPLERASRFNVARARGALETVLAARRLGARAIVAHGPTLAAWCSIFARLLRVDVPIVAHTFNFTFLPKGSKWRVFRWALSDVPRFVVFSTFERGLYARELGVPEDRFDVVLWGMRTPESSPGRIEEGDYVCAIGGNARDFPTLLAAARLTPELRYVLVVRPESLVGLELPPNVKVHVNLAAPDAMNVLGHARFMVLPLLHAEVPCGHVTMVSAMLLGRAFVITESAGVQDYVMDGKNALSVQPGSAEDLAAKTRRLWDDPELCRRLGEFGQRFARDNCSEQKIVDHFRAWLVTNGVIAPRESPAVVAGPG